MEQDEKEVYVHVEDVMESTEKVLIELLKLFDELKIIFGGEE